MSRSLEIDRELSRINAEITKLIELRDELNALEDRRKKLSDEFNEICRAEKQALLEKKKASCQELMEEVAQEDFDPAVKEKFLGEIKTFSESDKFMQTYDEIDTEACSVKEGLTFNTATGKVDVVIDQLDYPIGAKFHEHFKTPRAMLERYQLHLEEKSKNGTPMNI